MRAARVSVVACILLLAAAAHATGQGFALRDYCDATTVDEDKAPQNPEHPSRVYQDLAPLIVAGRWSDAIGDIQRRFESTGATVPAPERASMAAQFTDVLAALRAREAVVDGQGTQDTKTAPAVRGARFDLVFTAPGYSLFQGTGNDIAITTGLGEDAVRALCWTALSARRVLTRYFEEGRAIVGAALGEYVTRWDNYHRHGYSQYLWELYLNGLWTVNERNWNPPAWQLVIAHPSVAVQLVRPPDEGLRRIDVIAVEPAGILRFVRDHTFYFGASGLVTLSSAADPGLGVLVHVGRIGKVGYVFRQDAADGRRQRGAVVSLDLYKLIAGVPDKLRRLKETAEKDIESTRAGLDQ